MEKKRRWKTILLILAAAVLVAGAFYLGVRSYMIVEARQVRRVDPGTWLEIAPEGIVSANGEAVSTRMRVGSENRVMVVFYGGGISVNEYTAQRPYSGSPILAGENGFYSDSIEGMIPDYCELGVGSSQDRNPFKNWTVIVIPYTTGDFHVGTGEFVYTGLDGAAKVLHHHGYTNYRAIMDEAVRYVGGAPEDLLIMGYSAGGFGAVLLADDLLENYFPEAGHVTVCVDSSYLVWDGWEETLRDTWAAPDQIAERIVSDNPIVDGFTALYEEYGDSLTYLYIGSTRDGELCRYQSYFDTGVYRCSNFLGRMYTDSLRDMLGQVKRAVPGLCVYLFDQLPFSLYPNQFFLTQHTILITNTAFWPLTDRLSAAAWLHGAVNGVVVDHGLDKLR